MRGGREGGGRREGGEGRGGGREGRGGEFREGLLRLSKGFDGVCWGLSDTGVLTVTSRVAVLGIATVRLYHKDFKKLQIQYECCSKLHSKLCKRSKAHQAIKTLNPKPETLNSKP